MHIEWKVFDYQHQYLVCKVSVRITHRVCDYHLGFAGVEICIALTSLGKIKTEANETIKIGKKEKAKKIWTISRFVRVILAQGPC